MIEVIEPSGASRYALFLLKALPTYALRRYKKHPCAKHKAAAKREIKERKAK